MTVKSSTQEGDTRTLVLTRELYNHEGYTDKYPVKEQKPFNLAESLKKNINSKCIMNQLLDYLPIIRFIRTYKLKEYILGDVLSGLTVSFLHLPMAMGFGILAGLRPINGLYETFFAVLTYMFFGTSTYISFGSNAVMALMTQTVVNREADVYIQEYSAAMNGTMPTDDDVMDIKVRTSMACCFLSGLILMGMGLLKLGVVTTYLSVSFVGGFTTAASIHIATSQVPKMFGIKVTAFAGAGKLVRTYIELIGKLGETNAADLITCLLCMAALIIVKKFVNERYKAKMIMPIPIDLVVVIIGTAISHFANFGEKFNMKIVGPIPSGFQAPDLPRLKNLGDFASDAFVMAILSLAMSISMAKLCARKHGTPIDDNQELIAYGASNFISGFFHSFPSATAPPRTMILSTLGARTTLNAIVTSIFMMLVILVIGQLFVSLPMSVLAAMIIVSMKDLLFQYENLPRIWRVNKLDFVIWLSTNLVGVLADLNYGIIVGVGVSIFLVVLKDQCASGDVIGLSASEDIVVTDHDKVETTPLNGVIIFKVPSSFYFATAERIKSQVYKRVMNPKTQAKPVTADVSSAENGHSGEKVKDTKLHTLILDLSSVQYMDLAGIVNLQVIIKEYKEVNVAVYLTGICHKVMHTLTEGDFFKAYDKGNVYYDVFDVVTSICKTETKAIE